MPDEAIVYVPKRGRPSIRHAALIDSAILATARSMFLEEGYDAVAMEVVAAVTGVSKGTLYSRYPSKDLMFAAVVDASVRDWITMLPAPKFADNASLRERLRAHARIIAQSLMLPDVRAYQKLLIATRDRFPELERVMYETGYRHIVDQVAGDIRHMAERDGIAARDPDGIARLLVSAISGWHMQESGGRSVQRTELVDFALKFVDLILHSRQDW